MGAGCKMCPAPIVCDGDSRVVGSCGGGIFQD